MSNICLESENMIIFPYSRTKDIAHIVKTREFRDVVAKSSTRFWHLKIDVTFLCLKSIDEQYSGRMGIKVSSDTLQRANYHKLCVTADSIMRFRGPCRCIKLSIDKSCRSYQLRFAHANISRHFCRYIKIPSHRVWLRHILRHYISTCERSLASAQTFASFS